MTDRSAFATAAAALVFACSFRLRLELAAPDDGPAPRPRPFRIQVVEAGTGRGVPLVELKTVNQIRYYTDSNGIVAFDEPGLFNQKVYFSIRSHGYEAEKDGFGYRGASFVITEGGTAQVVIHRLNIARRLYRVTGEGIYRDSLLTGDKVPIREPLLERSGLRPGQRGECGVSRARSTGSGAIRIVPDYPLGNFHVPGATSELPGRGGLEPEEGVNLSYFVDEKGFARPTAAMPGEGPTWISGLTVLTDDQGRERMLAFYAKIRKVLEVYERGLVEFNARTQRFEKVTQFPEASQYSGEHPDGHAFLHQAYGINYVYYANPYPLLRVRADPRPAQGARGVRGLHVPGARHAGGPAAARPRAGPAATLRLEDQDPAPAARSAGQADRCAADDRGGVAAEPARHRLGQDRGGPRRICLLEQLSQSVGDDHRRVVRQHVSSGRSLVRRG